jgi:hypothetical protein
MMSFSKISNRIAQQVQELAVRNEEVIGWGEILIIIGFYALLLTAFRTEPGDDLLRHMKVYTYGFDYRQLWPFSPGVPSFDPYLFFDKVAGAIHAHFGPNGYILLQLAALALYTVAIFGLCEGAADRNWRFTLTLAAVALVISRICLARPSVFESGLFLLGAAACKRESIAWYWHLALGLVMASFYYLFFIYLIPLVVYRRAYLWSMVLGVAGWFAYGGMEYVRVIHDVFHMQAMRDGLTVMEESSLLTNLFGYLWLLIPLLYYWRRDLRRILVIGWFFLSNQARYLETVIPLLVSYAQYWPRRMTQLNLVVILISLFIYTHKGTPATDSFKVLEGAVPAGSRVLCLESPTMYQMVYANEHLQVVPCQDVAWDAAAYRSLMMQSLTKGRLNPEAPYVKGHPFDYLVERNLREVPQGLTLYKIIGRYRVWKFPGQASDGRTATSLPLAVAYGL